MDSGITSNLPDVAACDADAVEGQPENSGKLSRLQ
jgi:hypothetical protein